MSRMGNTFTRPHLHTMVRSAVATFLATVRFFFRPPHLSSFLFSFLFYFFQSIFPTENPKGFPPLPAIAKISFYLVLPSFSSREISVSTALDGVAASISFFFGIRFFVSSERTFLFCFDNGRLN